MREKNEDSFAVVLYALAAIVGSFALVVFYWMWTLVFEEWIAVNQVVFLWGIR